MGINFTGLVSDDKEAFMSERISRDEMLMEMAHTVAKRGTCSRLQVGAVFAVEGRVVATGYNGAPPGLDHCIHESFTWPSDRELKWGDSWYHDVPRWMANADVRNSEGYLQPIPGETYYWDGKGISWGPNAGGCGVAEHAERNAVAYAARHGITLGGSDLYCTHAPCRDCSRTLISAGIRAVYYDVPYRLTTGLKLLHSVGIRVIDMGSKG